MKTYLTMENTVGFNQVQLDGLNSWIARQLETWNEDHPHYLDHEKNMCDRAQNFYQEILGEMGIDYDDE